MAKHHFRVLLGFLSCLLMVAVGTAAVTVDVNPLQINSGETIQIDVAGLENGSLFSLEIQGIIEVGESSGFFMDIEDIEIPICLENGVVTAELRNTVENSITVKKGDTEVTQSGNSVDGVFSKTVPFEGCLNGTLDLVRFEGTAEPGQDDVRTILTIDGTKTGPNDFSIPITITGSGAVLLEITARVDGVQVFDGSVMVGQPEDGEPATGTLSVSSTPVGAAIYIDGVFSGVTPQVISGISPGIRTVMLSMPGFDTFITTAEVEPGNTTAVSGVLQPSEPGEVKVNITPHRISPGGTVTVNITGLQDGTNASVRMQGILDITENSTFQFGLENILIPSTTCLGSTNVTGILTHTVNNTISIKKGDTELRTSGKSVNGSFSRTVQLSGCTSGNIDFIRLAGTAQSTRDNVVATVRVDGTKVSGPNNFEVPITVTGLESGSVRITVLVNNEVVLNDEVMVDNPSLKTGALKVNSLPAGAGIYIDGIFEGETPKLVSGIPPGVRNIQLAKQGFRTFSTTAEVSSGFTASVYGVLQSINGSTFIGGVTGTPITPFVPPDDWAVPAFAQNGFIIFPTDFVSFS